MVNGQVQNKMKRPQCNAILVLGNAWWEVLLVPYKNTQKTQKQNKTRKSF